MKNISLICTVHEERGLANVSELYAILERVRPSVIFLEVPPNAFEQFYISATRKNLESISVRLYRENNRVELIPVDIPTPDFQFFEDYAYLQGRVERDSRDSHRLLTSHKRYVHDYGFAYLNSELCSKMFCDIYLDELATIKGLGDTRLNEISEAWEKTNEFRENEMMKNISNYCRNNKFERGAFLIGAAHRQSIIDKSTQSLGDKSHMFNWDISWCSIQTN